MKILIDMQGAQTGSRFRGIGRYTISLVESIIKNRGENEIILLLNDFRKDSINDIKDLFSNQIGKNNIVVFSSPKNVFEMDPKNHWRLKASEYLRESFVSKISPDFILLTTVFEGYGEDFVISIKKSGIKIPTAIIFYDLIPLIYKDKYLADTNVYSWYKNKLDQCKKADLFLAISNSSKNEAVKFMELDTSCVINISSACDKIFHIKNYSQTQVIDFKEKFKVSNKFLMYSGATDERKNHLRLLQAYSLLPMETRNTHQLVFVGGLPPDHKANFLNVANELGFIENELIITDRVTDDEMVMFYNLCTAFIFPSWHEGFGLPALEALQCGKAVIASNTTSLPEVVGRKDALFDPEDITSIKNKINQVLTNDSFRESLEKHSLLQAKKFSWDKTALRAIKAIQEKHNELLQTTVQIVEYGTNDVISDISKITNPYQEDDIIQVSESLFDNTYEKQLLVDFSELAQHDSHTGIQRVTRSIITELLQNPPIGWCVKPVYASLDQGYVYSNSFFNNSPSETPDSPIEYNEGDVFLGLDLLHPLICESKITQYLDMKNEGVSVYFVIYDLLPIQFPEYSNLGVSEGHQKWLNMVTNFDGGICISKTVANELSSWMKMNKPDNCNNYKISWFHLGADIEKSRPTKGLENNTTEVINKLEKKKTFLMVGTIEPRKAQLEVLQAFDKLWNEGLDINLVFVGKFGWLNDSFVSSLNSHKELDHRLFWLKGISDEYLEEVYRSSDCLISASYGEGFGLPIIEAAIKNIPVIARDIPVFREVAGKGACYFSDNQSISSTIELWLDMQYNNRHPEPSEIKWLTWAESTNMLLNRLIN